MFFACIYYTLEKYLITYLNVFLYLIIHIDFIIYKCLLFSSAKNTIQIKQKK